MDTSGLPRTRSEEARPGVTSSDIGGRRCARFAVRRDVDRALAVFHAGEGIGVLHAHGFEGGSGSMVDHSSRIGAQQRERP